MQIALNQVKNLSYVVIDDLYLPEEVTQIKTEIQSLLPHLNKPTALNTATDEQGIIKHRGSKLYIDDHYVDRNASAILRLNRKIFCDEIVNTATQLNQFFYALRMCNRDFTLLNRYAEGEEYKAHEDNSVLTVMTFFSLGEINGGGLKFPNQGVIVPFKENRAVIFPGCALHATQPIVAKAGAFRMSIAQFLKYAS
jgi:hypothetical protein